MSHERDLVAEDFQLLRQLPVQVLLAVRRDALSAAERTWPKRCEDLKARKLCRVVALDRTGGALLTEVELTPAGLAELALWRARELRTSAAP